VKGHKTPARPPTDTMCSMKALAASSMFEVCMKPVKQCLQSIVERLLEQDEMNVFAKPVSEQEVPGYHSFIKNPMDLCKAFCTAFPSAIVLSFECFAPSATMSQKAKNGEYFDLSDLQRDFSLMISNCLKFNKKNVFFIKYAQNMRKAVSFLSEQIRF